MCAEVSRLAPLWLLRLIVAHSLSSGVYNSLQIDYTQFRALFHPLCIALAHLTQTSGDILFLFLDSVLSFVRPGR